MIALINIRNIRRYFVLKKNTRGFLNRSFILRSPFNQRSRLRSVDRLRSITVLISFTKFRSAFTLFTLRALCVSSSVAQRSLAVQVGKKNVSETVLTNIFLQTTTPCTHGVNAIGDEQHVERGWNPPLIVVDRCIPLIPPKLL